MDIKKALRLLPIKMLEIYWYQNVRKGQKEWFIEVWDDKIKELIGNKHFLEIVTKGIDKKCNKWSARKVVDKKFSKELVVKIVEKWIKDAIGDKFVVKIKGG